MAGGGERAEEELGRISVLGFKHSMECGQDCVWSPGKYVCQCGYTLEGAEDMSDDKTLEERVEALEAKAKVPTLVGLLGDLQNAVSIIREVAELRRQLKEARAYAQSLEAERADG